MKHTQGKWEIQLLETDKSGYKGWNTYCIRASNNCHLATVGDVDRFHANDTEANARLIAAAPDLLKTAKTLLIMLDNRHTKDDDECPMYNEVIEFAEQAIAQAQS